MITPTLTVSDTYGVATGVASLGSASSHPLQLRLVYNATVQSRLDLLANRTSSPISPRITSILLMLGGMVRPMWLTLLEEEGLTTVVNAETGVFGAGDTAANAALDFLAALHEHLDVLMRQERLSNELQRQLDIIQSYLPVPSDE